MPCKTLLVYYRCNTGACNMLGGRPKWLNFLNHFPQQFAHCDGRTANNNLHRLVGDRSMVSLFKKLWNNKRGNALVIAGAALPMVVGAAGLASDTIQWTLWKRQLQRAADSAAMSGVYTRLKTNTQQAVSDAVIHDESLNLHTWMSLKAAPTV